MPASARVDRAAVLDRPISVLIVDDSVVARAAMTRIVASADGLRLADAVDSAARAIDWLQRGNADVILLDIDMPGRSGLAALPELLRAGRGARILIVASTAHQGAEATVRALALGAADTLAKPSADQLNQKFGAILIDRVQRLGHSAATDGSERVVFRQHNFGPVGLLAIGASTGGLRAMTDFFKDLPASFACPILVTQHLPPAFMPYFAAQLAALSGRRTRIGEDGGRVPAGEITVAPGDAHLLIAPTAGVPTLTLSRSDARTGCCPSVDPMLTSAAHAFGSRLAAVVLSGMGRDGFAGAETVIAKGGSVAVQDSASSAVWGMPGAIARAGLADYIGTPARLAAHLARRGTA